MIGNYTNSKNIIIVPDCKDTLPVLRYSATALMFIQHSIYYKHLQQTMSQNIPDFKISDWDRISSCSEDDEWLMINTSTP